MKIKIYMYGLGVTITYLKTDGELTFNPDGKSGLIHVPSGKDFRFEVV